MNIVFLLLQVRCARPSMSVGDVLGYSLSSHASRYCLTHLRHCAQFVGWGTSIAGLAVLTNNCCRVRWDRPAQ